MATSTLLHPAIALLNQNTAQNCDTLRSISESIAEITIHPLVLPSIVQRLDEVQDLLLDILMTLKAEL